VRLQVAKIAANGSMRRWVIDTAGRSDADRWEELIARVPAVPPPYRAAPGSAVYDIRVDDDKFLVGEHDLSGPLSDLVRAVLIEGDAVLAAWRNRVRRAQLVMLQQHTGLVTVVVTQIAWDGSIRRRARDTCSLTDAGRWPLASTTRRAVRPTATSTRVRCTEPTADMGLRREAHHAK
jgi:hypothetical protein